MLGDPGTRRRTLPAARGEGRPSRDRREITRSESSGLGDWPIGAAEIDAWTEGSVRSKLRHDASASGIGGTGVGS